LREAIFGGAVGGVKRRKVESVEEGGNHKQDRKEETKREEGGREDVVLLAEDATNERVVFVYRGVRPVQMLPTNVDKDKGRNTANPTSAIGSKRPREEEQDDEEYGAVYDVFRERRVGWFYPTYYGTCCHYHRPRPLVLRPQPRPPALLLPPKTPAQKACASPRARSSRTGGQAPAAASRKRDRERGSDGKVVWRRTIVMRNVCESDVEFGKDGICLWVKVAPRVAKATSSTTATATTPTTSATATTATTTTTTPTAPTVPTATTTTAPASVGGGGREKEPRLTRLEVECDGTVRSKDERRGVVFPCKVWRWRPPPRVPRTRAQKVEEKKGKMEGEETKMEVEV
jgi:hypothetical protein